MMTGIFYGPSSTEQQKRDGVRLVLILIKHMHFGWTEIVRTQVGPARGAPEENQRMLALETAGNRTATFAQRIIALCFCVVLR
jgi:hypothetical protein